MFEVVFGSVFICEPFLSGKEFRGNKQEPRLKVRFLVGIFVMRYDMCLGGWHDLSHRNKIVHLRATCVREIKISHAILIALVISYNPCNTGYTTWYRTIIGLHFEFYGINLLSAGILEDHKFKIP